MFDLKLRTKLAISFGVVVIITGFVTILAGIYFIGAGVVRQAQIKVTHDLSTARYIFSSTNDNIGTAIKFTAARYYIIDILMKGDTAALERETEKIRKQRGLDVLTLTDNRGRVVVRARNPGIKGDSVMAVDIVRMALAGKDTVAGVEIFPEAELRKEGKELAGRARIAYVPTPRAKPTAETGTTSGMMMVAATPILDYEGRMLGVLYGGNLLNRDCRIVDEVKRTVFQGLMYQGKDVGTTTIFLKDVRISTNVMQKDGTRAIGTRVWTDVFEKVLVEGKQWIGRAFVVNAWYITAYEPIRDVAGRIVGILYVGILEREYAGMKTRTLWTFLLITAVGMAMAIVVAFFLAAGVTRPLRRLVSAAQRMAEGDLEQRIAADSNDEIGELSRTFNLMASSIRERDEQLKRRTQQMLMKSDRLATIGQLAAGVAHEINNPLGGILVYSHLLLEDPAIQGTARENLGKIVNETTRCKKIVKGLLDFARQSKPEKKPVDVNEILASSLGLVEKQALFQDIKVTRNLDDGLPGLEADLAQLQQVFLNVIINAAEAMNGRGSLTVGTRFSGDGKHVEIEFTDTGCGISGENMRRLFEPFFTTKDGGRGTGLGLAISYGIIGGHNGTIDVKSEVGKGTTFIVRLPIAPTPAPSAI